MEEVAAVAMWATVRVDGRAAEAVEAAEVRADVQELAHEVTVLVVVWMARVDALAFHEPASAMSEAVTLAGVTGKMTVDVVACREKRVR